MLTPEAKAEAGRRGLTGMKRFVSNDRYSVQFFEQLSGWGPVTHLIIRRHDQGKSIPWAHKQRIKDELVGADRTAVEVFPSAQNLVDDADVYHLWVLPVDFALPFGLHQRGWSK